MAYAKRLQTDMEWQQEAACAGKPSEWWFPHNPRAKTNYQSARKVCASCPVSDECLKYGLSEHDGMWGGQDPKERRAARVKAKRERYESFLLKPDGTKTCSRCFTNQPATAFSVASDREDGRYSYCTQCRNKHRRPT